MILDPIIERALTQPQALVGLSPCQWDRLIQSARRLGLLARIQVLLAERGLFDAVPTQPKLHLESARIVADNEQRIMRWEVNRIQRALGELSKPVILLKGAAYLLAGLSVAKGRISTDVDILVDKADIADVESVLLKHGWEHTKIDEYDQFYYRVWSHELPPLRHRERGTTIDVHHTILPLTGRCHPDPKKLLAEAITLDGSQFKILAPADLVLHSSAHAFQDGDLVRGLRDLVDLDDLLRHFGVEADFWDRLVQRSQELDLTRPLYYALRYTSLILHTPVPAAVLEQTKRFAPARLAGLIMDRLVIHAVNDRLNGGRRFIHAFSSWALYMRQHWLRMPPFLLARHLVHQMFRPQKLRTDLG
jgi:putative nucleotidyltransferase-like protein